MAPVNSLPGVERAGLARKQSPGPAHHSACRLQVSSGLIPHQALPDWPGADDLPGLSAGPFPFRLCAAELKAAGCTEIFQEKISGAKADRKQLAKLIGRLGKDDVLVVTRLDRLARSTKDLLNTLGTVADKGAGFRSLRDTWADTTTAHGRLMLTVLGGLAEFERELIDSVEKVENRTTPKISQMSVFGRFRSADAP